MPIYAYRCATCGHAQDVLQKMSDPLLTVCPACGAATYTKQLTAAGFQLKGSGWYVTDFKDGAKPAKPAAEPGAEKPAEKPDDKAADKSADKPAPTGPDPAAKTAAPAVPEAKPAEKSAAPAPPVPPAPAPSTGR